MLAALVGVVPSSIFHCPLSIGTVSAQITVLDWDEMSIDSVLPVYSEVVPLETDYRVHDYAVAVEYPEWGRLTAREEAVCRRFADRIGEELDIRSRVSVSRKQGMLDITFCPIVRRDGHYWKLLSGSIAITATSTQTSARRFATKAKTGESERYTRRSVLSEGKWVKISVTDDGMYRLTRSALQQMGFAKPENVRLYGYGGHRLSEVSNPDAEYDDLQEVPLYKADSNTWLFWANGLMYWDGDTRVFNPYATTACYFLTEADTPSQMKSITSEAAPVADYDSFADHVLYEKDEYAWFHGGRNLFENVDYANSGSHTYKLSTVGSMGSERLTIAFTAAASTATTLTATVNGTALPTMTMAALSQYVYGTETVRTTDVSSLSTGQIKIMT